MAASEPGPPDDYVSACSQSYELAEGAPVQRVDVTEASKVLSEPGELVSGYAIQQHLANVPCHPGPEGCMYLWVMYIVSKLVKWAQIG